MDVPFPICLTYVPLVLVGMNLTRQVRFDDHSFGGVLHAPIQSFTLPILPMPYLSPPTMVLSF